MDKTNLNKNQSISSLYQQDQPIEKSKEGTIGKNLVETYGENYSQWRSSNYNVDRDLYIKTKEISPYIKPTEASSVWDIIRSIYSVVRGFFSWEFKKPPIDPNLETTNNLVNKIVGPETAQEWDPILKDLTPQELKQLNALLESFDQLYTKRSELLATGKDVSQDDDQRYGEIRDNLNIFSRDIQDRSNDLYQKFKGIPGFLSEKYKNANVQTFTDNAVGAVFSEDFKVKDNDTSTFGRYSKRVNGFYANYRLDEDPSIKFLAQNRFVKKGLGIYESCRWEMELGEKRGEKRLFEKGYCQICFATPGSDLKEIRIPLDFRFLELTSPNEVEVLLGFLADLVNKKSPNESGQPLTVDMLKKEMIKKYISVVWSQHLENIQNKILDKFNIQDVGITVPMLRNAFIFFREEFERRLIAGESLEGILGESFAIKLNELGLLACEKDLTESLKDEMKKFEKGLKPFVDKCCGEHFEQVKNMLDYVSDYVSDMLDKVQFSLGKDLHIEGVFSHFEVFPKILLKKICSEDKEFNALYVKYLNNLQEYRKDYIAKFLNVELGVPSQDINLEQDQKKIIDFIRNGSLNSQDKASVIKYLDYLHEISTKEWNDSSLAWPQITAIGDLLKQWKTFFEVWQWPKELEIEIVQMLIDPTTCRLLADFLEYAALAKEENKAAVERGEVISIDSYHNARLRMLCNKIFDTFEDRVENLEEEKLLTLLGETLLRVYINPPF